MSDALYQVFLDDLASTVREKQIGGYDAGDTYGLVPREEAFTETVLEKLSEGGELPDLDTAYFNGRIGAGKAQVNAYSISEIDGRVDLVVAIAHSSDDTVSVPARDVEAAAKRAVRAFNAAKKPIFEEMEPSSSAADMFERLHVAFDQISHVRVVVIVDGEAKVPKDWEEGTSPRFSLDVWDHTRIYRVSASGLPYESVRIDMVERLGHPVPCVACDVDPDDHSCVLAILPGDLLFELYDEFGARLLELNVRSFLQARGKVNKGIRDTLSSDPDHFLAFNNGISATVEEIEFAEGPDGAPGIAGITGFQIVNGGQTTASIHRAGEKDGVDLSRVRVQAKITVVKPEYLDSLVPNISRYSNTQNKVNETDFSANHPFHVRFQQLSEKIWAPGETTRWFYERARGQFEVARARDGSTPAKRRVFDAKTPRAQRVDKTLLARATNSWAQKPHIVSRGGQKNFVDFMTCLPTELPDEQTYRDSIAKVILFKAAERIARRIGFSAYRANAVCYSIALLSYRTSGRVDLDQIWREQSAPEALDRQLTTWMPIVHEGIIATAEGRNVTEWAKKIDCWAAIQNLSLDLDSELQTTLREGLPLPNVGAFRDKGFARDLTEEEIRRQEQVMALTSENFSDLFKRVSRYLDSHGMRYVEWNAMTGCLSTVQTYAENGWTHVPTPKQTKQILKAISFLEEREGASLGVEE